MMPSDAEFPIEWLDPSDPEITWEWDDMHMPGALSALAGDYALVIATGMAYGHKRLGTPVEMRIRVWNGYAYYGLATDVPEAERDAMWQRRIEGARAAIKTADSYWHERAVPEVSAAYAWVAARPVETMPAAELADTWDEVWERIGRCWSIHFYAIRGPYQVLDDLADLYESVIEGSTPGEALGLIGGGDHELQAVERDLEELAAIVARTPGLAERLAEPGVSIDELVASSGATEFGTALTAFLARHGHLGQNVDDLNLASWAEEPGLVLAELAKRVRTPGAIGVEERRLRLAADADALAGRARNALAGDPSTLTRFEAILADARQIGHLTETHNYWIDRMAQASLRRFVVRVGQRLAEAGAIEAAHDIFHLHRDEVPDVLRRGDDHHAVVEDRRLDLERFASMQPPRHVGAPAEDGGEDRFDGVRVTSSEPDELRGTGASAGIARGPARVTLTQADFEAVRPGDIIVCPSSNPSWVPLFAIAGGLITNTGGVLSHAAVVAREFALPAVVGTGDATTRIADGRLVELDGSSGIVRLL
jgi:phosphohistidine swiveling domain-containing protein